MDYARHNITLLGNRSCILTQDSSGKNDPIAEKWIMGSGIPVYEYTDVGDIDDILSLVGCDAMYCIKYGTKDGVVSHTIPTFVHCVFDLSQPHGSVYAAVSESLARKYGATCYVPHMISMAPSQHPEDNLRLDLGIPESARVFGRHGGRDTFNLQFAKEVMSRIVRERQDIYFVFMNCPRWEVEDHPQLLFLAPTTDLDAKRRFICTCDAMIVPETMGHTFGMSVAEFSIHQKPVVCYAGNVWNTAHIDILGDRGLFFDNPQDLHALLTDFDPASYSDKDMNAYRSFSPELVMAQFDAVFMSTLN